MATTTAAPRKARPRKTVSAMATMPVSNTPAARKARGETVAAPKATAAKTAPAKATAKPEAPKAAPRRKTATPKAKPAPVPFVEVVPMNRCQETEKHERKMYKCDDLSGTTHEHYAWINDATMLTWGVR